MPDYAKIEKQNAEIIAGLNQRGGETLSIIDLIAADTLSFEMAGELIAIVEAGDSIMSCAKKSGVGKSTLLAALMAGLPHGERIVLVDSVAALDLTPTEGYSTRRCYLAHEISPGAYLGYIWADSVKRFFTKAREGNRIASTLHADELDEFIDVLTSQGVEHSAIWKMGLVTFMRKSNGTHRVETAYTTGETAQKLRWLREESEDMFLNFGARPVSKERAEFFAEILEGLARRSIHKYTDVRNALLKKLRSPGE